MKKQDLNKMTRAEKLALLDATPVHYNHFGIECIDVVKHFNFNIGNIIKYAWRCGHKAEDGYTNEQKAIEDLQKVIFYANCEIDRIVESLPTLAQCIERGTPNWNGIEDASEYLVWLRGGELPPERKAYYDNLMNSKLVNNDIERK